MSGRKVSRRRDDALSRVGWQDLERLVAAYYRGQGYEVEHVGTGATQSRYDGGIDLKLRRADEYILVQCKHWNAWQVAHNPVHELLGIAVNQGASGAILISSGEFTRAAREAASRLGHVQLIDGDGLREMLGPLPEPDPAPESPSPPLAAPSPGSTAPAADTLVFRSRPDRGHAGRNARPVAKAGRWWWGVLAGAVLFVLLVRALLDKTAGSAGEAPSRGTATAATPAVQYEVEQVPQAMDTPSAVTEQDAEMQRGVRKPTAAEAREAQRRADEAIKVLEATTPEL